MLLPLVTRAKTQGQLEVDSILATFGLTFIFVGIMIATFGGEYFTYSYLAEPLDIFGDTYALNRVVAFAMAAAIGGLLCLWLYKTRQGMAVRAVGGALISTFLTMDASVGILFTMKALVIVIMGGVGDVRGAILAAIILGFAETAVATLIDPGLTLAAAYLMFILVLLLRPQGLFGRRMA